MFKGSEHKGIPKAHDAVYTSALTLVQELSVALEDNHIETIQALMKTAPASDGSTRHDPVGVALGALHTAIRIMGSHGIDVPDSWHALCSGGNALRSQAISTLARANVRGYLSHEL